MRVEVGSEETGTVAIEISPEKSRVKMSQRSIKESA
jgi:hypothetical protein